ncbi:DgyrCDS4091 [Dimorphilus gyrociliatus]|uniref:DgyrCDS4091 n=1 Tax=Dimorphilus gyrociliatus TaxID=2664684 RepID=A0A7I8VGE7_9ANNE|nr:DgyrCDS4091 [Dimorphilus gyrociliatus]
MGKASSKSKLSKEDLDFLLTNTNFNKRQIKQWYKGFMRDCPSGQLTRKKFLEVYSGFFPEGNAEKFCEHVFRTFDSDNSGRIDFKEFLLAINITSAGKPEEKLEWAFQMYDINGDGTIDVKEMVEIITAIYNMVSSSLAQNNPEDTPERRTAEIFDKMDENKDGVLSKEEFIKGCMNDQFLYQMLTADQSGFEQ